MIYQGDRSEPNALEKILAHDRLMQAAGMNAKRRAEVTSSKCRKVMRKG